MEKKTESTFLGGIYQENVAMTALVALSIDRRSSDFCCHNNRKKKKKKKKSDLGQ